MHICSVHLLESVKNNDSTAIKIYHHRCRDRLDHRSREAALYLPASLSGAIKEVENEAKLTIFNRCRAGVALTPEGMEFVGYARQVVQQMELLESRFVNGQPEKQRFCVSTQHYTFAANAFADLIMQYGQERYEFIMNETQTHQIIEDVRNRFSDLGLLYLCLSLHSAALRHSHGSEWVR